MDFLEYKQINEAVKYIEDYNPANALSDTFYNQKLNSFEIKDKIMGRRHINEGKNSIYMPISRGNGCTEGQMQMIREILLSTEHNYKTVEKELISEYKEEQIKKDVANGTYKGKTLEDYENLRLEAVNKIKNSDSFVEKLVIIQEYSAEIHKGLSKIAIYKLIKEAADEEKINYAAERMIKDKLTLTQISDYLGTDILNIYNLYVKMLDDKKTDLRQSS